MSGRLACPSTACTTAWGSLSLPPLLARRTEHSVECQCDFMAALNRIVSHKCGVKFQVNKKSMHLQVNGEQRASQPVIATNTKPIVGGNNLLGWHLLYYVGRQRRANDRSMLGPRYPSYTLLYSPMAGSACHQRAPIYDG